MKLAAAKNLELKTPAGDAKAFEIFNELLKSGDKSVLNTVGALYFLGKGVGRDYGKARKIFESGSTLEPEISQEACLWLALMHMEGLGVKKSEETSQKYLQLTCKLGSSSEVFDMAKFLISAEKFPIGSLGPIPHSRKLGAELMKCLIEENAGIANYRDNSTLEYAQFLEDGKYILAAYPMIKEHL